MGPNPGMERLIAETLARLEAPTQAPPSAHRRALEHAASVDGVEAKLLTYFAARPEALPARRSLSRQMRRMRWLAAGMVFAAFLVGAGTAAAALQPVPGAVVNILWCLLSLVGLNLVLFGLWLVVIVVLPDRPATRSFGAMAVGIWRRLARRTSGDAIDAAARRALLGRLTRPPSGRWIASGVSHGLWLGYGLGAVAMCLVILSTRHIVFVWETTILAPEDFRKILAVLGALPASLGFSTPDAAQINAAEWTGGAPPLSRNAEAWSGLLLGGLTAYGVIPRLLALGVSWLRAAICLQRPLDLGRPEFARLIPELAPVMRRSEVMATDDKGDAPDALRPPAAGGLADDLPDPPPAGAVALLGWEITEPEVGWPPPAGAERILDLGLLEDRHALDEALAAARKANVVRILVVCDLTVTPDRGVVAGLRELCGAASAPVVLILSREASAARRLGSTSLRARTADWVAAAHAAGISLDHVVTVDFDRFKATDRRRFAHLAGAAL